MPTEMLSPHFALSEFTISETAGRHGLDNTPPPEIVEELRKMAALMERVRTLLGDKPIQITSGYRAPAVNAAVGSSAFSHHCKGQAVDFICPGFGTPREIAEALLPHLHTLEIDQLIWEFGSWVHLSHHDTPRKMALTIDHGGTRSGIG
jgi:hypothetical protein